LSYTKASKMDVLWPKDKTAPADYGQDGRIFAARFSPEFIAVRHELQSIRTWAEDMLSKDDLDRVSLVLAEAMYNIVEHAGLTQGQFITVYARYALGGLTVMMRDQGKPFPDNQVPAGTKPECADFPEGGYGWLLIHELSDRLTYHRTEFGNSLTLFFETEVAGGAYPTINKQCPNFSLNRPH